MAALGRSTSPRFSVISAVVGASHCLSYPPQNTSLTVDSTRNVHLFRTGIFSDEPSSAPHFHGTAEWMLWIDTVDSKHSDKIFLFNLVLGSKRVLQPRKCSKREEHTFEIVYLVASVRNAENYLERSGAHIAISISYVPDIFSIAARYR